MRAAQGVAKLIPVVLLPSHADDQSYGTYDLSALL